MWSTTSHGPVLSKSPAFTYGLLARALARKYGAGSLTELDDTLEHKAAAVAKTRPR